MLIIHRRELVNYVSSRVVSVFWSHDLLCQVRRNTNSPAWLIDIRLWGSHPWLTHQQKLERWVRDWVRAAVPLTPPFYETNEVVIFDTWCVVRSNAPCLPVRDCLVQQPEQYWYREAIPKRDKKHYRLAKTYMETLCCTLCDVMSHPP